MWDPYSHWKQIPETEEHVAILTCNISVDCQWVAHFVILDRQQSASFRDSVLSDEAKILTHEGKLTKLSIVD